MARRACGQQLVSLGGPRSRADIYFILYFLSPDQLSRVLILSHWPMHCSLLVGRPISSSSQANCGHLWALVIGPPESFRPACRSGQLASKLARLIYSSMLIVAPVSSENKREADFKHGLQNGPAEMVPESRKEMAPDEWRD